MQQFSSFANLNPKEGPHCWLETSSNTGQTGVCFFGGRQGGICHEITTALRFTTSNFLLFKHRPCTPHCKSPILVTLLQILDYYCKTFTTPQAQLYSVLQLEVLYICAASPLHQHQTVMFCPYMNICGYTSQRLLQSRDFTELPCSSMKYSVGSQLISGKFLFLKKKAARGYVGFSAPSSKGKTHCSLLCSARDKLKM